LTTLSLHFRQLLKTFLFEQSFPTRAVNMTNHTQWVIIQRFWWPLRGPGMLCSASVCQNTFNVQCVEAMNKNAAVQGIF